MTNLFDELNEEYSKLNAKHNALMVYASDIQKKLDLSNIELSQLKNKCHANEETDKIIEEIVILIKSTKYFEKEVMKGFYMGVLGSKTRLNNPEIYENLVNSVKDSINDRYGIDADTETVVVRK